MAPKLEMLTILFVLCGGVVSVADDTGKKGDAAPAKAAPAQKKPGKRMPVEGKETIKNNVRRALQSSQLEKAQLWIEKAIKNGKRHPDNNDLLGYGYWAKAVLSGYEARQAKTEEETEAAKTNCLKFIDTAIENGWRNPFSFEYAALIDDEIRKSAEFRQRIEKLTAEFSSHQEADFRAKLKSGLETPKPFTLPGSVTGSEPLSALVKGKPAVLVVSRIYHDGFRKLAPVLNTLDAEFRDSVPTLILFYQSYPASPRDQKLTEKYYRSLGLSAPSAFVTRADIALGLPIFPVVLFLDAEGGLVLRQNGLFEGRLLEDFLRIAYGKLKETAVTEAPVEEKTEAPADEKPDDKKPVEDTPAEPEKKEEKKEEKPAEPHEKDTDEKDTDEKDTDEKAKKKTDL